MSMYLGKQKICGNLGKEKIKLSIPTKLYSFAFFSYDDSSLNFGKSEKIPPINAKYKNKTVHEILSEDVETLTSMTPPPWVSFSLDLIEKIDVLDYIKPQNMYQWFSGCIQAREANLQKIDTTSVDSMDELFNGCMALALVNLENFDLNWINSCYNMFLGCDNLQRITVGENFLWTPENYLPPSSFDTNGYWYTIAATNKYLPEEIPDGAGTYYASARLANSGGSN